MSEAQRLRILSAMADVASRNGIASTTVAQVVARAGMSRRTFYDLFENLEDCFLAVFEEAIDQAEEAVLTAWHAESAWLDSLRAGLLALLDFFDAEPALAQVCVVQAMAAGPVVIERRAQVVRSLAAAIDEGRSASESESKPPPVTAEGLTGAVLSVVYARLSESDRRPLRELAPSLTSLLVLPYLGQTVAGDELSRPLPEEPTPAQGAEEGDAMQGLDMRLTYRTLRVLAVIADSPGTSNREIAEHAGIADQGQISRLLTRLDGLGLIEKISEGHAHGTPNAWKLTARGVTVNRSLQPRL